jgi:hypothetical protein
MDALSDVLRVIRLKALLRVDASSQLCTSSHVSASAPKPFRRSSVSTARSANERRAQEDRLRHRRSIMKTLFATAFIALGLLSSTIAAQAASFDGYPDWARQAFEQTY